MSGTAATPVKIVVSADIAQFLVGMEKAAIASEAAFAKMSAQAEAASAVFTESQLEMVASMRGVDPEMKAVAQAALQLTEDTANLGSMAQHTARHLKAMVDESLAGRWNQFSGSLSATIFELAALNPAITATIVAVAALSAGVGILAYRWYEAGEAARIAQGEMLISDTSASNAQSQQQIAQIKQTLELFDIGGKAQNKALESLGDLNDAAAQYGTQIAKVIGAQSQLTATDVPKATDEVVKAFNSGSESAIEWADHMNLLTESQKEHLQVLSEAGNTQAVFSGVLQAANDRFADGQTKIAEWQAAYDKIPVVVGRATAALHEQEEAQKAALGPRPQALQPEGPPANPVEEQGLATANKLLKTQSDQAVVQQQLIVLQNALSAAQKSGDTDHIQEIQQAISLLQNMPTMHSKEDDEEHAKQIAQLQAEADAHKHNTDAYVADLQKIADAQTQYYGEGSVQAEDALAKIETAQLRVSDAGITAGNQQTADLAAQLKTQLALHEGDYQAQEKIQDQILQMYAEHYGKQSTQYQEALAERIKMTQDAAQQEITIAKMQADTEKQIRQLQSKDSGEDDTKADDKGINPTLEALGFTQASGELDQYESKLHELQQTHAQVMDQIAQQQKAAMNPIEMQTALDDAKIEVASFGAQVTQLQSSYASQVAKQWVAAANTMEEGFNKGVLDMIQGTSSFSNFVRASLQKLVLDGASLILKGVENWVNAELEKYVTTQATNALIKADSTTTALSQVAKNAAVAATGAYAATAGIPFVGPILAPAAAAAAYAATMAFGVFDVGAYNLPTDMMGVLHKGEMVVPTTFAEGIRSGGGLLAGAGSGGTTLHYSPQTNISGNASVSRADLAAALKAHSNGLMEYVNNMQRNGNLTLLGRATP